MIRSKFFTYQVFGQFIISAMFIGLIWFGYMCLIYKKTTAIYSWQGLIICIVTVAIPTWLFFEMRKNYKKVIINTEQKNISFRSFIFNINKTYPLEYFDRYIETKVRDKYGDYRCFYLIKNKKAHYKISGRFYSNIDELGKGLTTLKNFGFVKSTISLSLKIAFNKDVLNYA